VFENIPIIKYNDYDIILGRRGLERFKFTLNFDKRNVLMSTKEGKQNIFSIYFKKMVKLKPNEMRKVEIDTFGVLGIVEERETESYDILSGVISDESNEVMAVNNTFREKIIKKGTCLGKINSLVKESKANLMSHINKEGKKEIMTVIED
ncbi:hypothetical protein H311_04591, partial [Anncaliia algerae PRA109]